MTLSISTRIFIGFTVVIIAFASTCAYTIYKMNELRQTVTLLWEEVMPVSEQLKELSRKVTAPSAFLELEQPRDAQWLARLLPSTDPFRHTRRIERRLNQLGDHPLLPLADQSTMKGSAEALRALRTGATFRARVVPDLELPEFESNEQIFRWLVGQTASMARDGELAATSPEVQSIGRLLRDINRTVIRSARQVAGPVGELSGRVASNEKTTTVAVSVIAGVATVLSLFILLMMQLTLKPIRALREGAQRIASGAFDERVVVRSDDEVGQLAEEFNTMANALLMRDGKLAAQRQELMRADRLITIGKMASQITHEVRNPLSSIGLNAELLEEELQELEASSETVTMLRDIHHEVDRLKAITEEYLRYARPPRPNFNRVELDALLENYLGFFSHELREADVDLITTPADEALVPIHADADQLRQVLINLTRNAVEALKEIEGPRVLEVGLALDVDDQVKLTVRDNGPGIDSEMLHQLFDPFVTGKSGGTGLGLALSRQIVVDHGGTITVDSPISHFGARSESNPGTCFTIVLPVEGPPQVVDTPGKG